MLKNRKLYIHRRRNFLLGLGALVTTTSFGCVKSFRQDSQVQALSRSNFSVAGNNTPLRIRAAAKGLLYGAFCQDGYKPLSKNQQLRSTFSQQCSLLVGGFYARWGLRPSESTFNFAETDALANFASNHAMLFRGHTLLYPTKNPQWLEDKFNDHSTSSQEIEKILINHVSTIVRRYAGQMHSWDVVNEAINPESGRSDGLAHSPWLDKLGSDYIDIAFRVAAEGDPKALLSYNDGALEYDTPEHEARRTAVLKMLKRLKSRGIPIHALGIQSHLWSDHADNFNHKKFRKFLADIASLGLKILITEIDVTDNRLPLNTDIRDRIVASIYEDYLSVVLDERAVIAVITWGLSDRYTWLSNFAPRPDGSPVRPLPFDSNLKSKLAWNALARAFDHAPKR